MLLFLICALVLMTTSAVFVSKGLSRRAKELASEQGKKKQV